MKKVLLLLMVLIITLSCNSLVFGTQNKAYTTPKQIFKIKGAIKSSNKQVAIVKKGKIKTLKKGSVKIKIKLKRKKHKCTVIVYSKKKMYNKLNGIYRKIEKQKVGGYDTKSKLLKSIKALKTVTKTGKTFFSKLVGARYRKVKKTYKALQKIAKKELKDKQLLLDEWDTKEDGRHSTRFYKIEDDVVDEEFLLWEKLVNYYAETFNLYAV